MLHPKCAGDFDWLAAINPAPQTKPPTTVKDRFETTRVRPDHSGPVG